MAKPLFERRHYEHIARTLQDHPHDEVWFRHVKLCIAQFKKDNPNFNPVKFWRACGMSNGEATLLGG